MVHTRHQGKNLRKGRVSIPGRIYSITTVTRHRQPVFADFAAARILIGILREHEEYGYAKTLCFVVMPDHLHWLMELTGKKNLGRVMQGVKSLTGRRTGKCIWKKGFMTTQFGGKKTLKPLPGILLPIRSGPGW